jgi:predicted phosphoribosyltransferase
MATQVTRFRNRAEAGRLLAEPLREYAGRDGVIVLGRSRSRSPRALDVPLDIVLVRKLGVPGHEEMRDSRADAFEARARGEGARADAFERAAQSHEEHALAAQERVDAVQHLARADDLRDEEILLCRTSARSGSASAPRVAGIASARGSGASG